MPQRGEGMNMHSNYTWLLETYTDADWSGNRVTRRSTSSAVHTINGIVVHCSSRGRFTPLFQEHVMAFVSSIAYSF